MSFTIKRELRRGSVYFVDYMTAKTQEEAELVRSTCVKAQLGENYQLYTEPSKSDSLTVYRVVMDVDNVLTVASQTFTIYEEN